MRELTRTGLVLGLLLSSGLVATQAEAKPLTLRINKTQGEPGELVAITLRTYQSRPVHQGQICLRPQFLEGLSQPRLKGLTQPFSAFSEALVFSANGDASNSGIFDPVTQTLDLDFFSASATINSIDGPLAVIFLRLSPNLTPGDEFTLDMDPGQTMLFDENNNPIPLNIRSGLLKIVAPGDAQSFDAEGARAEPGTTVTLSATTLAIEPLSQGQATFLFDPALVTNILGVSIDPRYGAATATVSQPQPGVAVVSFQSPNGTLNWIPGAFVALRVRISSSAVPGTLSPVNFDPAGTFLLDRQGQSIPIVSKGDVIEIVAAEEIFSDGFETGSLSGWTLVVP